MLQPSSMRTFHTRHSPIILTRGNSKWESFLSSYLLHSAKGSTWEEHKYIKRIDGTYYYPDSYEGGRHLPDSEKNRGSEQVDIDKLEDIDVQKLAEEGIKGNFGNGQERKEALGTHYQQVQDRINQVLDGNVTMTEVNSIVKESGSTATQAAVKKAKGIDLDTVYAVYGKDKKKEEKKGSVSKGRRYQTPGIKYPRMVTK